MIWLMIVGAPPQSVTKLIPMSVFFSQSLLVASIGRVVQGQVMQSEPELPSQEGLTVHGDELLQPPWHCIRTVKAPLSGVSLKACLPILRVFELYSTVKVFRLELLNACCPIEAQPEVRVPHSFGNV